MKRIMQIMEDTTVVMYAVQMGNHRNDAKPVAINNSNNGGRERSARTVEIALFTPKSQQKSFIDDYVHPGGIEDVEDDLSTSATLSSVVPIDYDQRRLMSRNYRKSVSSNGDASTGGVMLETFERGHLSDSALRQIREAFQIFDRNSDGRISCQEIERVLQSLGDNASKEEVQRMLEKADINGNGTIEFEEFVELTINRLANADQPGTDDELNAQAVFEVFDLNKDGSITLDELREVMRSLGEDLSKDELDAMMKAADTNGDGLIDFNEFCNMFMVPYQQKY